jgi:hypothetical protein
VELPLCPVQAAPDRQHTDGRGHDDVSGNIGYEARPRSEQGNQLSTLRTAGANATQAGVLNLAISLVHSSSATDAVTEMSGQFNNDLNPVNASPLGLIEETIDEIVVTNDVRPSRKSFSSCCRHENGASTGERHGRTLERDPYLVVAAYRPARLAEDVSRPRRGCQPRFMGECLDHSAQSHGINDDIGVEIQSGHCPSDLVASPEGRRLGRFGDFDNVGPRRNLTGAVGSAVRAPVTNDNDLDVTAKIVQPAEEADDCVLLVVRRDHDAEDRHVEQG